MEILKFVCVAIGAISLFTLPATHAKNRFEKTLDTIATVYAGAALAQRQGGEASAEIQQTKPSQVAIELLLKGGGIVPEPPSEEIETDEQLIASGQWRDPETGLIWMRCALGQNWTGKKCDGEALQLVWKDSVDFFPLFNQQGFAGHNDWRLPNIAELASIRYCNTGWQHETESVSRLTTSGRVTESIDKGSIMIDVPNNGRILELPKRCDYKSKTPMVKNILANGVNVGNSLVFWSSNESSGGSTDDNINYNAWGVNFKSGDVGGNDGVYYDKTRNNFVIAVRGGR